jgi:hypothetical protein
VKLAVLKCGVAVIVKLGSDVLFLIFLCPPLHVLFFSDISSYSLVLQE